MATAAFRKFKKSMDAAPSGRSAMESYDLHALGSLKGDERMKAQALLLDRIASLINDPRAPAALRSMGAGGATTHRHSREF